MALTSKPTDKPFSFKAVCCLLVLFAVLLLYAPTYKAPSALPVQTASTPRLQHRQAAAFLSAAAANLTAYRDTLLQSHIGSFHPFKPGHWALFPPVITCPPDRPLTRYGGGGDGSKLLCKLDGTFNSSRACTIYSLGSNGQYQFEAEMLKNTPCRVFTFDCTYNGTSLDRNQRHQYYKWCLGSGSGEYRTWRNITETLGHGRVDLLKMDIEGFEFGVLSAFRNEPNLPEEISLEMHVRKSVDTRLRAPVPFTPAELALTFLHMANLGYASYSQEVNSIHPECCSEFSMMRVSK